MSFVTNIRAAVIAALCLTTAVFTNSTTAQEREISADNLKGFDGVVTQCVTFVKYKFANNMCKRYMDWISSYADANKVPHAHLGQTQWGYGTDEYLVPPADSGISNPAYLTLYIRATQKPDSVFLWTSLYAPQEASGEGGRKGRLVVWEDSGIGAGRRNTITRGLADGLAQKTEKVIKALGEANR